MRPLIPIVAAVLALSACSAGYDEAAHRSAVEAYNGGPVKDWEKYKRAAAGVCDADAMGVYVAGWASEGNGVGTLILDVQYQCPERTPELAEALGTLEI